LPKNFSTVPEKTAMLICKITLPDSPHPVIISKNPGFPEFFSVDSRKNLAFARKIMALPESGSPPSSYAYAYQCEWLLLEYLQRTHVYYNMHTDSRTRTCINVNVALGGAVGADIA